MSEPYQTRRQHPRFNVDVKVSVLVASERFEARTRDISRAGVCLVADKPIDREAEIELELVLTFGDDCVSEPLPVTGKVAWITPANAHGNRPQGLGIQFADSDGLKELRKKIEGILGGALHSSSKPTHTL